MKKRLKFLMPMVLMLIMSQLYAQTRNVSGTVTERNHGEPLMGVSVLVKGTSIGVLTDLNGMFSIEVPLGSNELEFKYLGYIAQTIAIDGKARVDLSLDTDLTELSEVVVVGYTTKQLSELSSSVAIVSGDELRDVTSNNISSMLQGKAAGVIVSNSSGGPNSTPNVTIRGSSSITAGSEPLYVVDGIIGGAANPNDVQSITILKDAAATGLYGSRAGNGVIIITTKMGRAGKTQVNFDATTGFNKATTGNFRTMNSQQLYEYQKTFFSPEIFARDRPSSLLNQNTNWHDLAFRTGLTQDYTISVSGGSENTQMYISGNYYTEDGTLRHTGNEAYSLRSNISHKINDKFKVGVRLDATYRETEDEASGNYGAIVGATRNLPWDNPFNDDGTIRMGTEEGWIGRERDNFLHGWQYNFDKGRRSSINGDIILDYYITEGLTFTSSNRASFNNRKDELYYDVRAKAGIGLGQLTNNISYSKRLITSNRLLYEKSFGEHNFNSIAVLEAEKNFSDDNRILGQGLVAGLHVLGTASQILSSGSYNGRAFENAFSKGLVQVDYNYGNRYFAVGSYINESSSRFGANNRAGNFYTLGLSWILSNERFMDNYDVFSLLKLRASYGETGNAQIENYQTLGLYGFSSQYAGNSASVPSQLANDDLTWEKAKTTNFGLDIELLRRVSLNVDIYQKTSAALLLNVQLPFTSGFTSVIQNVGSVRNRGLEINLNTQNLNGNLKWETNFNMAINRSKVLKLDGGKDIITDDGFGPPKIVSVGHDLNSFYMRKWAGVNPENGDPLWEKVTTNGGQKVITTTNVLSEATPQFVGSYSPDFTGGMNNTLSYKAFTLSAFLNFVSGNQVYNASRASFDSDGAYETVNNMVLPSGWTRWEKPGDIATHPKSVFGGNKNSNKVSSRYLEDGSYIRLRNVKLSYELSRNLLAPLKIAHARLFISADNLWTSTKYSGMDPEVSLAITGGNSSNRYPMSKKVLFGINVGL